MMFIKFTKNQLLILNPLFNRPEQSLYMREIGRLIGKEPGIFQKDINNLEKQEVLNSYRRGNMRFFKINKKYPLYKEIKSIVFKTVGIPFVLKEYLNKIKGAKNAFLFGSFASGEQDAYSDIDLMVIGDNIDENKLVSMANKVENLFGRELNYMYMTNKEFNKRIKSNEPFLNHILKKKIIDLF